MAYTAQNEASRRLAPPQSRRAPPDQRDAPQKALNRHLYRHSSNQSPAESSASLAAGLLLDRGARVKHQTNHGELEGLCLKCHAVIGIDAPRHKTVLTLCKPCGAGTFKGNDFNRQAYNYGRPTKADPNRWLPSTHLHSTNAPEKTIRCQRCEWSSVVPAAKAYAEALYHRDVTCPNK